MKIWLITVGEPLPVDGPKERLLRTGILANSLANSGHHVVWWTSTFDHVRKRHRANSNETVASGSGYNLKLLHGPSYRGNVSLRRILNHRSVASSFRRLAPLEDIPDVILCSWPLVELCAEAVRFGKATGVPVVLDIRDMWPDAIVDTAPRILRPALRMALASSYSLARNAASQATGLMGITDGIVEWGIQFAGRERRGSDRAFPMGYQTSSFSAESLEDAARFWQSHGLEADGADFVVCFFGTIGRHFEFGTIAAAAKNLLQNGRQIKFILCGDGPRLSQWKKLSADCPNIILPGWVDGASIHELMRISSIGLAPYYSSWDFQLSIPNKPIEYMSAGLPVVSSLQGVLADVLRDNCCGLTYRNGDSDDLVRLLSDCYDQPAFRREMARNAERLFRQRFTAEAVYADVQDYLVKTADDSLRRKVA